MRKIKEYRQKAGLSQKALGEKCNVSDVMIHYVEVGRLNPSIFLLRDIATALGVTMEDLME